MPGDMARRASNPASSIGSLVIVTSRFTLDRLVRPVFNRLARAGKARPHRRHARRRSGSDNPRQPRLAWTFASAPVSESEHSALGAGRRPCCPARATRWFGRSRPALGNKNKNGRRRASRRAAEKDGGWGTGWLAFQLSRRIVFSRLHSGLDTTQGGARQ